MYSDIDEVKPLIKWLLNGTTCLRIDHGLTFLLIEAKGLILVVLNFTPIHVVCRRCFPMDVDGNLLENTK